MIDDCEASANLALERRGERRYPIETKVAVHRSSGETIAATAVNFSCAGMLLHLSIPAEFRVDEVMTVEIGLPETSKAAFRVGNRAGRAHRRMRFWSSTKRRQLSLRGGRILVGPVKSPKKDLRLCCNRRTPPIST